MNLKHCSLLDLDATDQRTGIPARGEDTQRAVDALTTIRANCDKLIGMNPEGVVEKALRVAIRVEERGRSASRALPRSVNFIPSVMFHQFLVNEPNPTTSLGLIFSSQFAPSQLDGPNMLSHTSHAVFSIDCAAGGSG